MVALLNLRGGHILLGVEKDQSVSGLTRDPQKAEEWVMEVARVHVQPATKPYWETIRWDRDRVVGIVSLSDGAPDKPYKVKKGSAWVTKVRVGTTTRDLTREEEARLYQQSGKIDYGLKPVLGAETTILDHRRLRNYFENVLLWGGIDDLESREGRTQLVNLGLATRTHRRTAPTVNEYCCSAGTRSASSPNPAFARSAMRARNATTRPVRTKSWGDLWCRYVIGWARWWNQAWSIGHGISSDGTLRRRLALRALAEKTIGDFHKA